MPVRLTPRILLLLLLSAVVSVPLWIPRTCAIQHLVLGEVNRRLVPLKRRAHLPGPADLDSRVTLAALLQRGSDRDRWSSGRAAALEGYIVGARDGAIEFANCLSFTDRDTHLEIAMRPDAPRSEQVIVEVTPALRAWARSNGMDWSTRAVQRLVGRKVSVAGWLLFDEQHAKQSENTRPGHPGNWRATAWELHPVTSIRPLD